MGDPTVSLTFHVECAKTKPGDAVFIVGSAEQLGAWNPENALPCATTAKVFPNWTSETVTIPPGAGKIEFKVIVQPADGSAPQKARWEGGANRALHIPKATGHVQLSAQCSWEHPEVTYRTKFDSGTIVGGGQGLRPAAPETGAAPIAPPVPTANMPRVDTGVAFTVNLEDEGTEGGDKVMDLPPASTLSMSRLHSRSNNLGFGSSPSGRLGMDSMQRRSSRHLCINSDGHLNTEMSRTPSLMLVDASQLEEECKQHEEQIAELEREQLNKMQRRMPSGSLLESMKGIIDKADLSKTVLLQGFNWESWRSGGGDWYGVIEKKLEVFQQMGITDIWLPPPSQSVAPQGYLPSQLFNLDGSKYGSQAALEKLIKAMHELGIRAVADIVVNHRCGDKQDSQGRWNQFSSGMTARPSFAGVMDWGGWAITLGDKFSDGTGEHHPGTYDGKFDAAPDIDHANAKVQQSISVWLRWLQLQVGFDAWRFDFVKGYDSKFVGLYCKKSAPAWAVGELWGDMQYDDSGLAHSQDKHRQDLVNWVNGTDKTATAFDFTTKGILQEAVRNCQFWRLRDKDNKPPGLIGWLPKYAVTFIDNHDTGSTQRHWPFPDDKVLVGYAYILTHPGIPSIFWDHVMDWGENHRHQIAELLKVRRESGIPVDAAVKILTADNDLYLAEIGSPAALRVALGPRHPGEPDRGYWSSGPSGNQYRVWVHKQATKEPDPPKAKEPAKPKVAGKASAPGPEATPSFPPVTVDGVQITQDKLKGMNKSELEKLAAKLEPVLDATKKNIQAKA